MNKITLIDRDCIDKNTRIRDIRERRKISVLKIKIKDIGRKKKFAQKSAIERFNNYPRVSPVSLVN